MVKQIADELRARGFKLGRATPIPQYRGDNRILVGIAALAVPSIFVLAAGVLRLLARTWYAVAAYGLTVLLYVAGIFTHHDHARALGHCACSARFVLREGRLLSPT